MASKIINLGGNNQKMVFSMLAVILLLEFGSLTKLQKIWQLAFTSSTASTTASTQQQNATLQVTPSTHPTTKQAVGMPV